MGASTRLGNDRTGSVLSDSTNQPFQGHSMKKLLAALVATLFAAGVAVAQDKKADAKKEEAKPAAKAEMKKDAAPAAKKEEAKPAAKAEPKKEEKKTEAKK
jgi:hypothetical protein